MRAHQSDADPDRMPAKKRTTCGREQRRYEIRVRGPIGTTIMQAFPTLTATRSGQDTLLTGSLRDQPALFGVIHEIEALGLELLELRHLPIGDAEPPAQSHEPSATDRPNGAAA